ncbi:DUF4192 domain-containing protein [Nocardia puris]|uniref:DUF4192 domain-containing protein n=1 Tax=Nocardia puris TaxID=208602 RepID=UPI002E1F372D
MFSNPGGKRPRVDHGGEFIAAVPALLGFHPERSLVVAVFDKPRAGRAIAPIEVVVRFDLDLSRPGVPAQIGAALARLCPAGGTDVTALVVDDRIGEPPPDGTDAWRAFLHAVMDTPRRAGMRLVEAYAVRSIAAGERWWSWVDDRHGEVPDPATSIMAVTRVANGGPIHRTRDELAEIFARDLNSAAQVAAVLPDEVSADQDRRAAALAGRDLDAYHRDALGRVLSVIDTVEADARPDARDIAAIAAVLRDRVIRDLMFALAITDHAPAAQRLWSAMTRSTTGRDRAAAATLFAYTAYLRGDTVLAGIAVHAALDADDQHPVAVLLDTIIGLGIRPARLRRLADDAIRAATNLGVDLGPTRA